MNNSSAKFSTGRDTETVGGSWRCRERLFDKRSYPLIMGIVNVTPDSFSDGGEFLEGTAAVEHALRLVEEGADIIDVGGESTRPGSQPVEAEEQIRRTEPVIGRLSSVSQVAISIDTRLAIVAQRAIAAGAHIVNDISALGGDQQMTETVKETGAGLVLMHMQGEPSAMQHDPRYNDVVAEVCDFLQTRCRAAVAAGIERDRIAIDPGIGFGKTLRHNIALLSQLDELAHYGRPVVVGVSRKSFLGRLTGRRFPLERLAAGLSATALAVCRGAAVIRTHDVAATRDAVTVAHALCSGESGG